MNVLLMVLKDSFGAEKRRFWLLCELTQYQYLNDLPCLRFNSSCSSAAVVPSGHRRDNSLSSMCMCVQWRAEFGNKSTTWLRVAVSELILGVLHVDFLLN